jgi:hypothetical protein
MVSCAASMTSDCGVRTGALGQDGRVVRQARVEGGWWWKWEGLISRRRGESVVGVSMFTWASVVWRAARAVQSASLGKGVAANQTARQDAMLFNGNL